MSGLGGEGGASPTKIPPATEDVLNRPFTWPSRALDAVSSAWPSSSGFLAKMPPGTELPVFRPANPLGRPLMPKGARALALSLFTLYQVGITVYTQVRYGTVVQYKSIRSIS